MKLSGDDPQLPRHGSERRKGKDRRVGNDRRRDIRFEMDKDDRRSGRDRRRSMGGWGSISTV